MVGTRLFACVRDIIYVYNYLSNVFPRTGDLKPQLCIHGKEVTNTCVSSNLLHCICPALIKNLQRIVASVQSLVRCIKNAMYPILLNHEIANLQSGPCRSL